MKDTSDNTVLCLRCHKSIVVKHLDEHWEAEHTEEYRNMKAWYVETEERLRTWEHVVKEAELYEDTNG